MQASPVIPVLVLNNPETAVHVARALVDGGLRTLEITLRTPEAFDAISAIKSAVPGAYVGAGTVNTVEQLQQCENLNVDFMVSPGLHSPLAEAALASGIPYLPGIATASEALTALNMGLDALKFFPAVPAGGVNLLKALNGPYEQLRFCPTGGINAGNYQQFLELSNVTCVGGSWVAPADLIRKNAWSEITGLAAAASN
ncbi:keto-deoxy-phosphogluconate aldolase [Chromatiales bacterium (ex Bugula neritina AB1)]|nr:keto-deoxy-phosphogluconate aldolase [Chromatiales bacterium (ex Bugula neritina AB1)]